MKKPSYYVTLPVEVRQNTKISANARLLYSDILSLSYEYGYCYAKNEYLSEKAGKVGIRAIIRWLNELEKQEYIVIENKGERVKKRKIYPQITTFAASK